MASPFSSSQLKFFEKFAEAMFDGYAQMAIPLSQVVSNFSKIHELVGDPPASKMRTVLTLAPLALGLDFTSISVARRRKRIEKNLIDSWIDIKQDLARLKALTYAAYYGHWEPGEEDGNWDNPVLREIGFTLPKFRPRAPNEPQMTVRKGCEIDPLHVLQPFQVLDQYDYIVVGSGSGGAVAARNLAPFGSVLIVEAGPFVPSPAISFEERRMGATLFKHGALQATTDNDIIIFQGRNVGGSPTVNNGICLKMAGEPLHNPSAPEPYQRWIDAGADIGRANLDAAYKEVGDYLGLDRAAPRTGQGNGNHLVDGWNAFAQTATDQWAASAQPGWFAKNYGKNGSMDACCSCGYCNTGCPYARKRAMGQSYLPDACKAGARILPDSKVERIVWAPRASGSSAPRRAAGVLALVGEGGKEKLIKAKRGVVVAAGAIASSKLLERSDVDGTGQGISLNVASPVVALMPPGVTPAWDEDQMTTAVDCGGFWLESHFQPPMSMAMLMGGWFGEVDRRMREYGRMRSAGVLLPLDRRGHLVGDKLKFKFKDEDKALLRKALATLTRVHFAAGALEVWPSIRVGKALKPGDDIDAFYAEHVEEKDDATLSSAHPHGGNPMHPDPDEGVVDLKCRLHGASNVLVTDASVFPACIGVNAQYTVMAIAQYATKPMNGLPPI